MNFTTPGGTATRDDDYTVLGTGTTVTFAAGANPVEATESVIMALAAGSGYTVYSPNQATILIYNNIAQIDLDVTNNGQL